MKANATIGAFVLFLAGCASENSGRVASTAKAEPIPLMISARQEELLARMQTLVGRPGEEAAEQMSYEGSPEFQQRSKQVFLAQIEKSKNSSPGSHVGCRTNGLAFVLRDGKVEQVALDADHIRRRSALAAESTVEQGREKAPEPNPGGTK
jgi:hypothetical protein